MAEWISVKDRLPEPWVTVLLWDGDEMVSGYAVDNGGGYWVTACSSYKRAKIDYHKYLRTKRWREKANARLKMDGYQCVLCKSAKNLAVHHITYENIGYEQMDDLISVCKGCHEKLHEHDIDKHEVGK